MENIIRRLRRQGDITTKFQSVLKDCKGSIREMQSDFVVTTIDKASNNFSLVCKKFYLIVLLKELGFDDSFNAID